MAAALPVLLVAVALRAGWYVVPSRQSANMIPASFRASATMAMNLPRRSAIVLAHCTIGSFGRMRNAAHAAWINMRRTAAGPALVMPVRRWRSELEFSPGTSPTYDCTACAD